MTADTESRLRDGLKRYQEGKPKAAAAIFAALLEAAPEHPELPRLLGLALTRAGEPQAALPWLAHAVAAAPNAALAHLHHGIALLEARQCARAAARFRRAAMLEPGMPAAWINLSAALLALGQPKASRAAARRALNLALGDADALHALARGHAACGDLEAARVVYVALLRQAPRRGEAWVDLGQLHARAGRLDAARQATRRALALLPDHAVARANDAGFGLLQGEITESLAALREIIARAPGCVPARLNLANALLLEREAAAALGVLEGAVPAGREGAHWQAQRALALLLLGRAPAARQILDAIPQPYGDAEILITGRRMQLARHAGEAAACEVFAARLMELIGDETGPLFEHRVSAAFDLARLRLDQGDPRAAFALWRTGHGLMRRVQPFSREVFSRFVDASIASFEDAVSGQPGADATPLFILGLPRSGTTLTEQILAAHAQVHGAGERRALHDLVTRLAGTALRAESVQKLAALAEPVLVEEAAAYLAALRAEAPGATYIIDKMPANALHLGFIARFLPGTKFILTMRDLRDTGLSIFQHRFYGYHPYAHELGDLGFYLAEHERLTRHWKAIFPDRLMEVRLIDWVEDFAGTLARLEAFLGLTHDPACLRFHENPRRVRTASAAQVRQPINARGIGRWRGFADELAPMIENIRERMPVF